MKKLFSLVAGLVLAALPASSMTAGASSHYWPDDYSRDLYYAYNPNGGSPYMYTPDTSYLDGRSHYVSTDDYGRIAYAPDKASIIIKNATFHIHLAGADPNVAPTAFNQMNVPYDAYMYRSDASTYANIQYKNIYPGVDLTHYHDYLNDKYRLGYDFTVAPGHDPNVITIDLRDADNVHIDNYGNLVIIAKDGRIFRKNLRIYQSYDGNLKNIPGSFSMYDDKRVGFNVANYDRSRPLYIDPVLTYGPNDFDPAYSQTQTYRDTARERYYFDYGNPSYLNMGYYKNKYWN